MLYHGHALGTDTELSVEPEGLRIGRRFLDFAEIDSLQPLNHRVQIRTFSEEPLDL